MTDVSLRARARRPFGMAALGAMAFLVACDADSGFGLGPVRPAYSFTFPFQELGRDTIGRCYILTHSEFGGPVGTNALIACHVVIDGRRINCSFFHADSADFPPGRPSNDPRMTEACYHPVNLALYVDEENPDDIDDGGYTPPDV